MNYENALIRLKVIDYFGNFLVEFNDLYIEYLFMAK